MIPPYGTQYIYHVPRTILHWTTEKVTTVHDRNTFPYTTCMSQWGLSLHLRVCVRDVHKLSASNAVTTMTTSSCCTTDSEKLHCCCHIPNKVENNDRMPDFPYSLQQDTKCPKIAPPWGFRHSPNTRFPGRNRGHISNGISTGSARGCDQQTERQTDRQTTLHL